jgi:hypothetical protein
MAVKVKLYVIHGVNEAP